VNDQIVWDIVLNKLPPLKLQIEKIISIELKIVSSGTDR